MLIPAMKIESAAKATALLEYEGDLEVAGIEGSSIYALGPAAAGGKGGARRGPPARPPRGPRVCTHTEAEDARHLSSVNLLGWKLLRREHPRPSSTWLPGDARAAALRHLDRVVAYARSRAKMAPTAPPADILASEPQRGFSQETADEFGNDDDDERAAALGFATLATVAECLRLLSRWSRSPTRSRAGRR